MDASEDRAALSRAPHQESPRRAASWSWPLIAFSIIPLGWILATIPGVEEKAPVSSGVAVDPAELAMLKLQAQVVIASQNFYPGNAAETLDELSTLAETPGAIAALALIEKFVLPESGRAAETIKKLPTEKMPVTAKLIETAIQKGVNEEERAQLEETFGEWFANLAPQEGGEESPQAFSIRSRAIVVFLVGSVCFVAAMGGMLFGAVLVIIHGIGMIKGGAVNALQVRGAQDGVYLECFALYLGVMAFGSLGAVLLHPSLSIIAYVSAVLVPFVWPFFRKVPWKEFSQSIGWHKGRGIFREIGAGIVGYFGVLSIASIGMALTVLLMFVSKMFADDTTGGAAAGPEPHPIVGWIFEGGILAKLACLFLAAVFAPFFEETFFRGMLHRYMRGRFAFLIAGLLGGLIFAVLHPQGLYAVPALAAMGVGFALIREWRDSLIAPMVAHAINNGVIVFALWAIL